MLDIVGAWLIAYEFVFGYSKKWRAKLAEKRISTLESIRSDIKRMWNLPSPPYTGEEIAGFKSEIAQKYDLQIQEQKKIIETSTSGHEDKSILLALLGLLLLTAGFILQIVGAISA